MAVEMERDAECTGAPATVISNYHLALVKKVHEIDQKLARQLRMTESWY